MTFVDDLSSEVKRIFAYTGDTRNGQVVPETDDIGLGNVAVKLKGTVLYADLAESTLLVTNNSPEFSAEIYKCDLYCSAKVIRKNSGIITAYDGDRIMAVFIGDSKNTSAARTVLQINYCVREIINPAIKRQYPRSSFQVVQAIGIDTSDLFVARTGMKRSNGLVWVGRSANYAAKLCGLRQEGYTSWITADVYNAMLDSVKFGGEEKKNMWEKRTWTKYGIPVYRSNWQWKP